MFPRMFRQTRANTLHDEATLSKKKSLNQLEENSRIQHLKALKQYLCNGQELEQHRLISMQSINNDNAILSSFSPIKPQYQTIQTQKQLNSIKKRRHTMAVHQVQNRRQDCLLAKPRMVKRLNELIGDKNQQQIKTYSLLSRKSIAKKLSSFKLR